MVWRSESPASAEADRHSQRSGVGHRPSCFEELETTEISTSLDDCQIVSKYNHIRFVLIMQKCETPADSDDIIAGWLTKLDEVQDDPDDPDGMMYHETVAEIEQAVIPVSETLIRSLAASTPTPDQQKEHPTLESHLYPPTFFIQVTSDQGILSAQILETPGEYAVMLRPYVLSGTFSQESAIFSASSLRFIQDLYIGRVAQVSYKGEVYVFKCAYGHEEPLQREIKVLQQITEQRQQGFLSDIPVPRYIGLVTSHDQVIGFLEEFVDGEPLSELDLDKVSTSQRRIWRRRIEDTIAILHKHGIVWGDVKPENILVHDDHVSIIDFGGGWTDGWVDEQLMETVEGDLQGLQRLVQFLDLRQ